MSWYSIARGGLLESWLSEQEAATLFHIHSARCESELTGDLKTGFCYWTTTVTDTDTLLKLVHCVVKAVPGRRVESAAKGGLGSVLSD